jgi:hypothetical protein
MPLLLVLITIVAPMAIITVDHPVTQVAIDPLPLGCALVSNGLASMIPDSPLFALRASPHSKCKP